MKNECFEIIGGNKLNGRIRNQTSKNASLPILSASLMCDETVSLYKLPQISDIKNMKKMLTNLGVEITENGEETIINATKANNNKMNKSLCKTMRSSLFLLGSMLNKFKKVDLYLPGGCNIGKRPIDIHIDAFKKLGVEVLVQKDKVTFISLEPKPAKIKLRIPSVGATENIIQFACKLKGKTIIINAAKEPEVVDVCNFLNQMGAKILGAGTNKITIYGVDKLTHASYTPIGDRIVAGTLMAAVAVCGGDVEISNACPYQNLKFIEILRSMGCQIDYKNDIIHIVKNNSLHSIKSVSTGFYPNFPTDLQSLMLAVAVISDGQMKIIEKVFENRFLTVEEMHKFNANIKKLNNKAVVVKGNKSLKPACVKAFDLRGGAALVVLSLGVLGKSRVKNINFIDRGYEYIENQLSSLGANIRRI